MRFARIHVRIRSEEHKTGYLFQMPKNDSKRIKFFNKIIKKNKKIYFALENLVLKDKSSLEKINEIWLIKKTLPYCIDKF